MFGISWNSAKTSNPVIGDAYFDSSKNASYVYDGSNWVIFSSSASADLPTEEEMDKYPAVREAWESYLIVRKLAGV